MRFASLLTRRTREPDPTRLVPRDCGNPPAGRVLSREDPGRKKEREKGQVTGCTRDGRTQEAQQFGFIPPSTYTFPLPPLPLSRSLVPLCLPPPACRRRPVTISGSQQAVASAQMMVHNVCAQAAQYELYQVHGMQHQHQPPPPPPPHQQQQHQQQQQQQHPQVPPFY